MTATILNGKSIAQECCARVKLRSDALKERGIKPRLAVVLVGNNPASELYVRNKGRAAEGAGIESILYRLPETAGEEELLTLIESLNRDESVHGILVQLPLPKHMREQEVLLHISPKKDVDGFHPENVGKLLLGVEGVLPCTPKGILHLIHTTGEPISGKHAVVIGRSNIVGKPMSVLLLRENATVTVCHSYTQNLAQITKTADILVSAAGCAGLVRGDMIKHGATVIDVGINRVNGKLTGDVVFDEAKEVAAYLTPVPGGVGPMTIAMLMENTVAAAEKAASGT